jgi:SAM-dependent methyltransferase
VRECHVSLLACPACGASLRLTPGSWRRDRVIEGTLECSECACRAPISGGVPRFVPRENYASGFGLEWTRHARTQYDSYSGVPVSEERFFTTTRWPHQLSNQVILEVGSGSGRFTEQALRTGATVVSLDYSYAVDANYASNGDHENVLIVQADVFAMPFRRRSFDRLFCFGMLQHTPDPERAFLALPGVVRGGGAVAADVYKATFWRTLFHTKYYVRPFTRTMDPERLYGLVQRWVDLMWPVAAVVRRLPGGSGINWRLMVADYSSFGLTDTMLKEWAYLDTFDMLAPRYDYPQRYRTVERWLKAAGLRDCEVEYTGHGIVMRGLVPDEARLDSDMAFPAA